MSQSTESLKAQIRSITAFYTQHAIDPRGGYFQSIAADGRVRDDRLHHLVSSCRISVNFARAFMLSGNENERECCAQGLRFIETQHARADQRGFHWIIDSGKAVDQDQYCYGYAFLLLAYASAVKAGIPGASEGLSRVYQLMNTYFWNEQDGLFADQYDWHRQAISDYRGQNANMHACEALIQAYETTQAQHYLDRALLIAENIVVRATTSTEGFIWEHYTTDWHPDFDYNKDDPKNLYKPWGYQPGHFTEWAKLLLILNTHRPKSWLVERATFLLSEAWQRCWDTERGGLFYGFSPDGAICDEDKYFWVQAETLAALAIAKRHKLNIPSEIWLEQLERYINRHFIANESGVWLRLLSADNTPSDDWVALPGAKCDYHTIGAYNDILGYA